MVAELRDSAIWEGDDRDGAADCADGVDGALIRASDFDVDLVRKGVVVDVEELHPVFYLRGGCFSLHPQEAFAWVVDNNQPTTNNKQS